MNSIIKILSFNISHYNYSLFANGVPLIKSLLLEMEPRENMSDFYAKDLCVTIKSKPEIFTPYQRYISLTADGRCDVSEIKLEMREGSIQNITEVEQCTIDIAVLDKSEVFGTLSFNIELQPYYYWSGFACMPEYICSLVTPNQPQIESIVSCAYELLRENGELPITDGYEKKNIKKVFAVTRAVYDSIRNLKITYNITKTDYLSKTIALQTCEMLMRRMIGSSMDISMVFAACLENLGLNPILVVFRSHVLIGCFLSDLSFTNPITENYDELMSMSKGPRRVLFLLEPTSMANGMSIDFDNSCRMAKEYCEKNAELFSAIIDIKAARACGIMPIPNRNIENGITKFDFIENSSDEFFGEWVDINDENIDSLEREISNVKAEIFDFSENNPIINADFKNLLGLTYSKIDSLISQLMNPTVLVPSPMSENTDSSLPEHCCTALEKCVEQITFDSDTIATFCRQEKMEKRLNSIFNMINCDRYYRYKTYVAFYYAKWISSDSSNTIYTPMFFYPCQLISGQDGYKIKILSQKAILNPVFIEKIKRLFTVNFAELSKIPAHEILNRRDYIFSVISSAFTSKSKFRIIPYITVGAYDFTSYDDYRNLTKAVVSKSLPNALFMGKEYACQKADEIDNDSIFPLNMPTPLEMDGFQKKALYYALENPISFISGNVNSGKTRIAANIIFNMVSKSKTVLYIGGTDSACHDLENYLQELKLKEFSLVLDPYAPDFNGVFEPHKLAKKPSSDLFIKSQRLVQKKAEVAKYYKALHKKQKTGFNLYQTVQQYEKYKNSKFCVTFTPAFIKELDQDKVISAFRKISELISASEKSGLPFRHPLAKIGKKTFSYDIKSQAVSLINSYKAALESFLDCQDDLCQLMSIDFEFLREDQSLSLEKLISLIEKDIDFIPSNIFTSDCKPILNRLGNVINSGEKRLVSSTQIFSLFEPHVLDLDANQMLNEYKNSLSTFFVKRNSIHKKLLNSLKNHLLDGKNLSIDSLADILYSLVHYSEHNCAIASEATDFKELFGIDMFVQDLQKESQALDKLKKIYTVCEEYTLLIDNICRRECNPEDVIPKQASVICDFTQNPDIFKRKFAEFKKLSADFSKAEKSLVKFLNIDIYSLKDKMAIKWYEYVYAWITELEQSIDGLKDWCEYLTARENALSAGLDSAVNLFENTQITQDEFRNAFLKGFFKASCEYILSNDQIFSVFSQDSCAASCKDIKELIQQFGQLIIQDVSAKLQNDYREYHNHHISNSDEEIYLSSKELDELFAFNLKLMQKRFPITVSYGCAVNSYLAEDTVFDCIIIDDVHTIPYYSLLGIISRSEKVVFLGTDTSREKILFDAPAAYSLVGRGGANYPDSLYSRLVKSCIACAKLPYKYGTRNDFACFVSEVFSLHQEHSVPYPSFPGKINTIHVNGVYERRGNLVNFAEASCVVEELKSMSIDETIAVCAFTRPQASLIRDMWNKTGKLIPNLGIYALEDFPTSVRDRVIISTVFSNNNSEILPFNPSQIAGDNHKFRLNSLFSSPKSHVTLVTSLAKDSLDDIEPYSDSLYAFKRFIKFIYDNSIYFAPSKINEFDKNHIKSEICGFLQKLGYESVRNFGTSELKIDIAVQSKENDGFILGILLDDYCGEDSDVYTTEILMPELLQNAGWNTIRVFTNDWYENYNKQLEKISEKLSALK